MGDADDVGEVDLSLGVGLVHAVKGLLENLGLEDVDRGVDLADRALVLGGVLLLDDPDHGAVVADDAAVPSGVGEVGGEHGDGVALGDVRAEEFGEDPAVKHGGVRGRDDDGAAEFDAVLDELVEGALHGAAGAGNVVLVGDEDGVIEGESVGGHLITFVPDDDAEAGRVDLAARGDGVGEEGAARDGVQDLRDARLHAGAGTSGEDNDGGGGQVVHFDSLTDVPMPVAGQSLSS